MEGEDSGDGIRGPLYNQIALSDLWVSSDEQAMLKEKNTADNLMNAETLQQPSPPFYTMFTTRHKT